MSSAFLFLAIVAIWAFVLVPRWLRRHNAAPQPEYEADYPTYFEDDGYEPQEDAADYGDAAEWADETDGADLAGDPALPQQYAAAGPAYAGPTRYDERVPASQPLSRTRVLQARRRLLTALVLLAAAAGACTVLRLTAWWVCVPPAVMLGMYLLLLREAAIADAERAGWLAEMELRRADRERAYRAAQALQEPEEQPSAEVIDISERVVGDMLYDQYADATVRAVGD